MATTMIELQASDTEFGCVEFGFISRRAQDDADEEDVRYERHVNRICRGKNINRRARVVEGVLYVESIRPEE